MTTKLPEEECAFFPFNEYLNLCMNDVMGRISSGTWIIWIAFTFFFFMDLYLKGHYGPIIARTLVVVLLGIANIVFGIPQARMQAFNKTKQVINKILK